jgi:predicted nucleic acid-binding protein
MGSTALIAAGERVLLDSVAIIYALGTHPAYAQLATEMVTRVVTGEVPAVISAVAIPEIVTKEYALSRRQGAALHQQLVTMPNVEWMDVTLPLANEGARLRAEYNLTTPDSLHVATALASGAGWLVTNDRRLRRVEAEGIRVWIFDDHLG